jgi:hypothetical protein
MTVTFSESVTGFVAGDISVTNGSVSGFGGSGTSYSFTVTPSAQGVVSVSVGAGVCQDSAGNQNSASSAYTFTVSYGTSLPNNLVATPTAGANVPTSLNLSRSSLAGLNAVSRDGYFNNQSNWKYIMIYYRGTNGDKKVICQRANSDFSKSFVSSASGVVYKFQKIILKGRNNTILSVKKSALDNASSADITVL